MYICECGEEFDELGEETQDHILNHHLELVESIFDDLAVDDVDPEPDYLTDIEAEDLYEEAILDAQDDLMDEIIDG